MFSPLFTMWGRRSSYALMGLFSLLILMALFNMQAQLRESQTHVPKKMMTEIKNEHAIEQRSGDRISKIPEQHLFGYVAEVNANDLPITSLQLQLVGVIAAIPETLSRIIISQAGEPGKVYSIGEIMGSIRIHAISDDGVVLENHGRLEKLPLERNMLSFQDAPKKLFRDEG